LTELSDGTVQWNLKLFDQSLAEHTNGLAVNLSPTGSLSLMTGGVGVNLPGAYVSIPNRITRQLGGLFVPIISRYASRALSPGGSTVLPGAPDNTNFYDLPQSAVSLTVTNTESFRTLQITHAVAESGGANLGLAAGSSIWFSQLVDEGNGVYQSWNTWAADTGSGGPAQERDEPNASHTIPGVTLTPGQTWTIRTKTQYRQVNGFGLSGGFFGRPSVIAAYGFWG
jgi:hypothetical protein